MTEEMHYLKIDRKTGCVTIDGKEYSAHELNYEVAEQDKVKIMTIKASNGDSYRFETKKHSFLGGYGVVGKIISQFQIDFPQAKKADARQLQRASILSGNIPHIDPPNGLLLKKGEFAIFTDTDVRYCQERTETTYHGGSVRVRVCKGVSIGGGRGRPVRKEYIATLDTGRLTLTNKRLIFSGDRKSTTIQLSKLAAIDRYSDAIDLTKENAVKKTMFVNIDGDLYADVIEQLVD